MGDRDYSDEFAVLDADGLVHPYPKPLSIRRRGPASSTTTASPARSGSRSQGIQQDARDVVCLAPLALEDHSVL
jgi:hypothetical protein